MSEQNKYEKMYHILVDYELQMHEKNQKRIKYGLRCAIIVPLIFLNMLFWLGGSKVIYMTLWIGSLFAICGYLILIEYMDTKIQKLLKSLEDGDAETEIEVDALIGGEFDELEARARERAEVVNQVLDERRQHREEVREERHQVLEEKKEAISKKLEEQKEAISEKLEGQKEAISEILAEQKQNRHKEDENS